jgi:hypothetical protein
MSDGGRVSLTNLCGQLVVTGILRMQSGSRDQGLTPEEPVKTEHLARIRHAYVGSERGLSSLVTGSLMSSRKELTVLVYQRGLVPPLIAVVVLIAPMM